MSEDKRDYAARPEIVCLCGSTKYKQAYIWENARLTQEGYIVLSVGLWGHHERVFPDHVIKNALDELHKRKIDLCDWVFVLDVGGYIGESTRSEIEYAEAHGKPVRHLSQEFPGYVEPVDPIYDLRTRLAAAEAEIEEGGYWQRRAKEAFENGVCPVCFGSEGHKKGCYIAELEAREGALRGALGEIKAYAAQYPCLDAKIIQMTEKALSSPAPVNLEAMGRVVAAAKIYHKQENPNCGKLMAIGKCKSCGCEIPSISDEYCGVCVWDILHVALADLEGGVPSE